MVLNRRGFVPWSPVVVNSRHRGPWGSAAACYIPWEIQGGRAWIELGQLYPFSNKRASARYLDLQHTLFFGGRCALVWILR